MSAEKEKFFALIPQLEDITPHGQARREMWRKQQVGERRAVG
jgi:hypothetical protein